MTFPPTAGPDQNRLLAYVADLELEVDRLRRQGAFLEREAADTLARILRLCTDPTAGAARPTLAEVEATARRLVGVVKDMHDAPGYHPAHDQVVAIAVRPLAEQVFRWQQRLNGATGAGLVFDVDPDYVEWFPARFRHILDNLFAHALRHRDPAAAEPRLTLGLRATPTGYAVTVSGRWGDGGGPSLDLIARVGPVRGAGVEAGLSVVRLLVEQSGGTLSVRAADDGHGEFALTLPRYDLLDYLE